MKNLYSFAVTIFEELEEIEYFGLVIACSYAEAMDKLVKDFGSAIIKVTVEEIADACNDTIVFYNKDSFLNSIEDILK